MTVRAPVSDLAEGERALPAETSRYLCRVRRLGPGDGFLAFDPDARTEADATILDASADAARIAVGALRPARVLATADLVLVYALAKGDKVDAVVRDATELGATRVLVTRTERAVVKASGDRATDKLSRWRRIAEQAARQCGRADPPAVDGVFAWADALEHAADCDARFCLDPHAEVALGRELAAPIERGASIAFAVGPEGGLSGAEIELARASGFLPVSLGPFVLRTETVAAAVLGAVRVLGAR
ncbi:MAG: 16S rRNA (uracil(1498)-N(3))-methyltransferase [Labilithrix sp.]|nr:16S rRNA (uracil(1498)-N(3))-methyltransferase [Labilithrix sp.]